MKKQLIFVAILASFFLAGCGDYKPDPARQAMIERKMAQAKALQEAVQARAETPEPNAELDPELEAKAKEIEEAFEAAQAAVKESKANGGTGNCSMSRQMLSSTIDGKHVATIIKDYSVTNPDGTTWHAVVEKRNGIVTKAVRGDVPVSEDNSPQLQKGDNP